MPWPTTRPSFLFRLRDGDSVGWQEFYDDYKDLIFRAGSGGGGIPKDKKHELLQKVMLTVYRNGKFSYDPAKAKFRTWLKMIVRSTKNGILRDLYREKKRIVFHSPETNPDAGDEPSPSHDIPVKPFDAVWDAEWQNHVKHQALEQLRLEFKPATYQAFDLAVLQEKSNEEVAQIVGMTSANVDVCKCRCRKRLRLILRTLEEAC